jgi:hypothetical protein
MVGFEIADVAIGLLIAVVGYVGVTSSMGMLGGPIVFPWNLCH